MDEKELTTLELVSKLVIQVCDGDTLYAERVLTLIESHRELQKELKNSLLNIADLRYHLETHGHG